MDGAGQALEQRERTVRHAGKVAMHVHAPVTKLDSPAKKIDEISKTSRFIITKILRILRRSEHTVFDCVADPDPSLLKIR